MSVSILATRDSATSDAPRVSRHVAAQLQIRGLVQGVGFRPFALRLAQRFRLAGRVYNSAEGAVIELEGVEEDINSFRAAILLEAPSQAVIDAIRISTLSRSSRTRFAIEESQSAAAMFARIPADVATCNHCRDEIFDPLNRRHCYPFPSCTTCGPRYSMVLTAPYDRVATSMKSFAMCRHCQAEYADLDDRRMHAQSNACAACGPRLELLGESGKRIARSEAALSAAVELLREGRILALKGLGGFQLLVRADRGEAVKRLRQRKARPNKPFAVMVISVAEAERCAVVDIESRHALNSLQNPIVLVKKCIASGTYQNADGVTRIAEEVAPGVGTIGLLLPTTPLHHLLLSELRLPVVATSGNRAEEPVVFDEQAACDTLHGIADAFLIHNRMIVRRVDDSVVRVICGRATVLRSARGFAPQPLPAIESLARRTGASPILATSGHQQTAVALWTGSQAVLAQHIGDLDSPPSRAAFAQCVEDLCRLYRCQPKAIACDLHPDYFTTQWAMDQKLPVVQTQHHFAHAVSCMAENDLLDREVLAFSWDGTGFGPDGTIWGGEALRATRTDFQRVASLMPFPLPGGEAAIRHPARAAFGMLWRLLGGALIVQNRWLLERLRLNVGEARAFVQMIERGVNSPWTSSMGRLFDGVSCLLLGIHETTYSGEAAIRLEATSHSNIEVAYSLPNVNASNPVQGSDITDCNRGDWRPMLAEMLRDLQDKLDVHTVGAKFHNTLAQWAVCVANSCPGLDVVLSGGCFQNRLLAERTIQALRSAGRRVHCHGLVPPGDGGLAVGQLAIAIGAFSE